MFLVKLARSTSSVIPFSSQSATWLDGRCGRMTPNSPKPLQCGRGDGDTQVGASPL